MEAQTLIIWFVWVLFGFLFCEELEECMYTIVYITIILAIAIYDDCEEEESI